MALILARQAGAALENARLYTELRSYIHQVERSQHAMLQAEKMAAAGRLTASIAHEINNPLQSLHNCLHLAGRKELSAAERQKYLEMSQSELDRLMATVQRMLDYYRPGARDRQWTDLNEVVQRVVVLTETQLNKNNIQIQACLAANLPKVMIVPSQIQQVLLNLVINSMEAMPDGGEIKIKTLSAQSERQEHPESLEDGFETVSGIDILVEDSGPGVAAEDRERIFEPFVSTKENGTGLGLAVSYGIVAAHGGTLSLVNGGGKGACFRITLPEEEIQ
jgi:two-component system NtrC family sensor kinase